MYQIAVTALPGSGTVMLAAASVQGLGGRKKPPVIWIITLLLILGASAAIALRIDALTPDKPAEPPLAQRWKAMGGG
jgi:hypothetical protein